MPPDALRDFQSRHSDWTGKPLTVDGKLGPRTLWALAIADLPRHRRDIVRIACSQHGLSEDPPGSNRGTAVDNYLRPAGVGLGLPWCAAFVSWVLREAGAETRYTASAAAMLKQLRPAVAGPLPGDVFGWVNPDGTGHVGFVIGEARVAIEGAERDAVLTLEGNSANRVRNCVRPREGLRFGTVEQPLGFFVRAAAPADAAALVLRQSEGTR